MAFMFLVSLRNLAVGGNFAFNHDYLVAEFSRTVETSDSRCDISSSVTSLKGIDSCRVVVELIKYQSISGLRVSQTKIFISLINFLCLAHYRLHCCGDFFVLRSQLSENDHLTQLR